MESNNYLQSGEINILIVCVNCLKHIIISMDLGDIKKRLSNYCKYKQTEYC